MYLSQATAMGCVCVCAVCRGYRPVLPGQWGCGTIEFMDEVDTSLLAHQQVGGYTATISRNKQLHRALLEYSSQALAFV